MFNTFNPDNQTPRKESKETTLKLRSEILNGVFDPVTIDQVIMWANDLVKSGKRGYICTVNVAILMMMRSNANLRHFVDEASLIVADGQPLVWASRLLGCSLPERVTGIDLIEDLMALSEQEEFGVYLMGATSEVIHEVAGNLQLQYPRLRICGMADGYFSLDHAEDRVRAVRESQANILLVGMGVPRQEYFLDRYWADLGVNLAIGVGGSFDVIAGIRQRAPLWVQETGLEWLFRLIQEPGRLWQRYLTTNAQFIGFFLISILKSSLRAGTLK
jgi:N-acetylglucosaminyldiphosphoundecaprenol N-acetyl-beta-D-mannosaminyltransferase